MRNWSKTTKALAVISVIYSLIITGLAAYFYTKVKWASQLMTFDNADPDFVDSILSFSVRTTSFLIPLIFLAIVFVLQYIIAAWFIVKGKTKQEKIFGYLNLIVGGLIFSPLYLLYLYFKKESKEVKVKTGKAWKVASATIVTPIVVVAPVLGIAMYQGVDKPTNVANIKYSTNSNTPNVIEIFTDGMDPNLLQDSLLKDENLKDFSLLSKFVVSGAETSFSLPTLMDGMKRNIYNQYDSDDSKTVSTSMTDIYSASFPASISNRLYAPLNGVDNLHGYFLNTADISTAPSYMTQMSGDPEFMNNEAHKQHADQDLQIVNWGQAKNDVAGSFGIAPYSQDAMFYEWMHRKSVINSDATAKGAHVLMQEFSTHSPRNTDSDGTLTFETGTKNGIDVTKSNAAKALQKNLDRLVSDLKALVDPNDKSKNPRSVYDNSVILVYGDHANHATPIPHPGVSNTVEGDKFHSLAIIKYPDQVAKPNQVGPFNEQRPFYAPYLSNMLDQWSKNKDTDVSDFMTKNATYFEANKRFLGFFNKECSILKWENDKLIVDRQSNDWNGNQAESGWITFDKYKSWATSKADRQKALLTGIDWEVK